MRKTGSIIILLLLLFQLLIVFVPPTTQTSKAWWNTDWAYYRVCYINTNGYSGYYQMKLNVSYDGGGDVSCEGHCQADFDDIRFVDIDNTTVLPYWKETYVDSQYAIFWINVSADAMSDGKILMYYGNPSATDESDGDDTFDFFDDFNDGTIDTSKWTIKKDTGTVEETNGMLHIKAESSWEHAGVYTVDTINNTGIMLSVKFKVVANTEQSAEIFYAIPGSETDYISLFRDDADGKLKLYTRQSGSWALRWTSCSINLNTWYRVKIFTTGNKVKVKLYNEDDILLNESEWISYDDFSPQHIFLGAGTSGDEVYFDDFFIAKYQKNGSIPSLLAERDERNDMLDFPPLIVAWWWIDTDYSYSQSMIDGISDLLSMNFTAVATFDPSLINAEHDNNWIEYKTQEFLEIAKEKGIYVIPLLWGTDDPTDWVNTDLDNPSFKSWFSEHLQNLSTLFSSYADIIPGVIFDDFGTELSKIDNFDNFIQMIRGNLTIGNRTDYFILFDDRYDKLSNVISQNLTVTSGYYYKYQGRTWGDTLWITYMYNHYDTNYPRHSLSIVLEAWEDFTADRLRTDAEKAMEYNFTIFQYYAWRRGTPESTDTLYYKTSEWNGIGELNADILSYYANLSVSPPSNFTATAVSSSQIDLSWTKGSNADKTYIERNTVSSWNRGEGTLIYNGTGTSYSDTGLNAGTTYYYQAWSYNATDNVYSSTYSSASATTPGLSPLSGWQYYKQLNITDSGGVSADYQMKLTIYACSGTDDPANGIIYCDNLCSNFPADIRFGTTEDPTTTIQLPQWIKSYNSTQATIWVKLPSNGSDTIYMFVGNSNAPLYSDENNTFLFFDDFNNLDKWTEIETGGKVEDGYLIHDGSSNKCQVRTNSQFESPIAIYVRSKYPGSGSYGYYIRFHTNGGTRDTTGTIGYEFDYDLGASGKLWGLYREDGTTWYTLDTLDGSWDNDFHDYKITIDTDGEIKAYEDGNLKVNATDTTLTSGYIELGSWSSGNFFKYDRIFVTKYADPEPTWSSFGSWTYIGNNPPQFSNENPSNGSTNQPLSLTWSVYISDPEGDTFNWTIECSNGQSASGTNEVNGTKSLSLTGLLYNTNYTIWVNATDSGSGEWTNATYWFITASNSPPVQSNPSPSDGATDVDVSLSQLNIDISDPEGDLMNWSIETSPDIGSASGNNTENGTITCPVSGLSYGTTYTWYVNVTDGQAWTNETYTFTTTTPQPPSNLKATSINTTTVSLSWTKSPDTDTTVVVRKEGNYPTSPSDGTVIYNGTAEEFTDTGLNPGTAYYYRAWSYAPNSYSSSYTQDMNYTYPDVPTDLQVTSFNGTSITISWTKGDGADMTKIYRGDTLVDTVSGTTYTDTGLTPSTLYTYHLYAYDSESGYSSLTSADISQYTKPSPPHDFSFSGDQNIYITWAKGTGADYTLIRYRNDSFPSSIDDGYLLYNGTGTSYYFPTNNTLLYISAWSYDTDSKLYSDVAHAFYIVNLIPPTLSLSFLDNGSINVSWSVEVPEGINHSVMIRYSTTDYPSSISDGTLLINTSTSNYAILTDLSDGDYYFSAWTYGEKYGSSRWSSTYSTAHIRVYIKNISIVNEETGNPFNLSKVYSFLVLVPEKNWSLDLKAENVTSFEYNSSTADQLKFEVKYSSDSSTIIRYINISLITESNFTIGYPENITTFYEQMIYSKKRIPILVKNIETGCYILAGETQFIREDVIYIPAYTINKMYRLYRYEDGRYSVIGLINGGKASEINLDLILYNTSTLFDIHLEGIGVKRVSSNLFLIYYKNDNNDNQKARIQIFDGDDVVFDYNETSTPNEFTIYFDISGLSLNNTNLKIKVTAVRTDGSKRIIVKYFSTKGGYGILNSAVGAILAIGLMIFGISLVASRHAFGIVGIVLCGISIAITAISTSAWYITFLQAIFIIILIIIILIYKEQNKGVVY